MKSASDASLSGSSGQAVLSIDVRQDDIIAFDRLTSIDLTFEEQTLAGTPDQVDQQEKRLLAIHFHPEWIPLPLIENRLALAFPQAEDRLVIPTQHNRLTTMGDWAGVEVDCFAPNFGQKIQLLIHFKKTAITKAGAFKDMLDQTFSYRAHQLLEILAALTNPSESISKEIKDNGLDHEALDLASFFAFRLEELIRTRNVLASERSEMLKNRLLTDFMLARNQGIEPALFSDSLAAANMVKSMVKRRLDYNRFRSAHEVIEEARSFNAGVIIPHPPQFWPALLDDLDVDGWEVWNPSTPKQTLFLIDCLSRTKRRRPLLAFMGDDTHMSSKIRPNITEDKNGAGREIGFQPPWFDPEVVSALKKTGQSRERTMDEYRARMA
ncbi:MAG: hypothetical protein LBJ64_10735 [Deltaproteobacteria bacterium]|jgi:hypothetical protein|nr:hypothetical protein [Deltaproteobacteria bacterium]